MKYGRAISKHMHCQIWTKLTNQIQGEHNVAHHKFIEQQKNYLSKIEQKLNQQYVFMQ